MSGILEIDGHEYSVRPTWFTATREPEELELWGTEAISLEIEQIEDAIEDSRELTTRGDDWDGEGTPGYSLETWEAATEFLFKLAECAENLKHGSIGVPQIQGAGEGSIDLYWRDSQRSLLLNFRADPHMKPTVSGSKPSGKKLLGQLWRDYSQQEIIAWLSCQA